MSILQFVMILVVLSLVWWLLSTYVFPKLVDPFKTILIVILVLAVCLRLLSLVGILGPLNWRLPTR